MPNLKAQKHAVTCATLCRQSRTRFLNSIQTASYKRSDKMTGKAGAGSTAACQCIQKQYLTKQICWTSRSLAKQVTKNKLRMYKTRKQSDHWMTLMQCLITCRKHIQSSFQKQAKSESAKTWSFGLNDQKIKYSWKHGANSSQTLS